MKVKLIAYTQRAEEVVVSAIRQCYSSLGAIDLQEKTDKETRERLIRQVIESGHTSTLEHASFTFAIEGVSRVTEIQLIRHRLASYSIQSGRYVKRGEVKYVIPRSIRDDEKLIKKYEKYLESCNKMYNSLVDNGIKAQDARYCQPQSLQTKIVMTMNARELLHFFEKRMCLRAQWEIREMAALMLKEVKKVAPIMFEKAGASCVSQGICYEGKMSCGLWEKIPGATLKKRGGGE